MTNPKFVLKKTDDDQFHFTLQAKNGETIMQSETYTEKHSAIDGIESVIENVLDIHTNIQDNEPPATTVIYEDLT